MKHHTKVRGWTSRPPNSLSVMNPNLIATFIVAVVACGSATSIWSAEHTDSAPAHQAIAVLHPTAGNQCRGVVRFTQQGQQVTVVADLEGLSPNQKHAFHVHQYGDCSAPDAMSAGGHYNPEGHPHGLTDRETRHAGDLGNVTADASGKAHYELSVDNLTIGGPRNPVIGRAVIVHAKVDDGSQPVGNAGGRIACGIIGLANPSPPK